MKVKIFILETGDNFVLGIDNLGVNTRREIFETDLNQNLSALQDYFFLYIPSAIFR